MLSRNAQEGFQNILKTCALQSFRCTEGSPKITLANEITDVKQDQFIMLTIVSYSFRAILLIHFKFSSDIKDYVKKASFSDENPDDDYVLWSAPANVSDLYRVIFHVSDDEHWHGDLLVE